MVVYLSVLIILVSISFIISLFLLFNFNTIISVNTIISLFLFLLLDVLLFPKHIALIPELGFELILLSWFYKLVIFISLILVLFLFYLCIF